MKTKHRKRTPRIFLSVLLTLVLAISIAAPLQALAAGDDVFYMSVSGTLRYDYANEVASLTNQQRAANGQAALQLDPVLTERAMLRAREISRIFEHTRPNGQDCSSVLDGTQFEFGGTGENIAMGTAWFFSPSIAMESWMNSSGHRANILGSSYQSLGVGVAVDSATGMACYVQLFSTLPSSGGSVSNGTVEYNSFVEGSDNCPYYNEIMGPTYLYYMSPVFDADYYMEANPDTDVLTGGYDAGAAFTHFLDYGMAEGRRGNEEFDVNSYRNQYGDLRAAYGDDLISYYLHYIDYGRSEGRQGSGYTGPAAPSDPGTPSTPGGSRLTVYEGRDYASVYDYDYYISHYRDVAAAYGGDQAATLRHFVLHGMSEGRQGCEDFDVRSYKNEYADLRAAYGDDLKSYYLHYVDHGTAEGRHGTGCSQLTGAITSLNGVDYLRSQEGALLQAVGITGRTAVEGEQRFLHQWTEWGFGPEAVHMAYERTLLRTGSMKWPYCNGILRRWHDKGAHTPEEIGAAERPTRGKRPASSPARPAQEVETSQVPNDARKNIERMRRLLEKQGKL